MDICNFRSCLLTFQTSVGQKSIQNQYKSSVQTFSFHICKYWVIVQKLGKSFEMFWSCVPKFLRSFCFKFVCRLFEQEFFNFGSCYGHLVCLLLSMVHVNWNHFLVNNFDLKDTSGRFYKRKKCFCM